MTGIQLYASIVKLFDFFMLSIAFQKMGKKDKSLKHFYEGKKDFLY